MVYLHRHSNHVSRVQSASLRSLFTSSRFEKSLYDLIRGLRNHKGNEREYIQHSLRECRAEIRGSDMGEFNTSIAFRLLISKKQTSKLLRC